jgi:hypothetical protein
MQVEYAIDLVFRTPAILKPLYEQLRRCSAGYQLKGASSGSPCNSAGSSPPRGALLMTLSAFSLPSFAGGIAGVASGLPLGFQGGFSRGPLSEFRIAGLLLGLQSDLTSGGFSGLLRCQGSGLTCFNG